MTHFWTSILPRLWQGWTRLCTSGGRVSGSPRRARRAASCRPPVLGEVGLCVRFHWAVVLFSALCLCRCEMVCGLVSLAAVGCVSSSSPVAVVAVLDPWMGNLTLNEHSHERCATKVLLLFHDVPVVCALVVHGDQSIASGMMVSLPWTLASPCPSCPWWPSSESDGYGT